MKYYIGIGKIILIIRCIVYNANKMLMDIYSEK